MKGLETGVQGGGKEIQNTSTTMPNTNDITQQRVIQMAVDRARTLEKMDKDRSAIKDIIRDHQSLQPGEKEAILTIIDAIKDPANASLLANLHHGLSEVLTTKVGSSEKQAGARLIVNQINMLNNIRVDIQSVQGLDKFARTYGGGSSENNGNNTSSSER